MNLGSELIDFPRHALYFRHKRCVLFDGITHLYTYIHTNIHILYIYIYKYIYESCALFDGITHQDIFVPQQPHHILNARRVVLLATSSKSVFVLL
jgi:hypothetical protein